jgi:hypothetical protein
VPSAGEEEVEPGGDGWKLGVDRGGVNAEFVGVGIGDLDFLPLVELVEERSTRRGPTPHGAYP